MLTQKGMFTCSGLTATQVDTLRDDHHVYMTRDGRISMASLSRPTCLQLAKAIKATLAADAPLDQVLGAVEAHHILVVAELGDA